MNSINRILLEKAEHELALTIAGGDSMIGIR